MRYALIADDKVINVILWDGSTDWSPPTGTEVVSLAGLDEVAIDWDYVDGQFVDNRPTVNPDESPEG
jgi:hypothetical protein